MDINVVGSGYVGTTLAASLADLGHDVTAIDVDEEVVASLNAGRSPIREPGLDDLVAEHAGGRLSATTSYDGAADAAVTFLAVQTPARPDGSIDVDPLRSAAETTGGALAGADDRHVVAVKSTVTPPAFRTVREAVLGAADGAPVSVVANPEFLREGTALEDFRTPARIVIGADDEFGADRLEAVYGPLLANHDAPVVRVDPGTAMAIKYASNGFLATKLSFINEVGAACKAFGIDTYEVADGIGLDPRIGAAFLRSGLGWGGSCLPKDVDAFRAAAREAGVETPLLDAAVAVNDRQPGRLLELLDRHVDVDGERVAVLGLAFKPGTDDTRNSRAVPVLRGLADRGASVVAYDPIAVGDMRERHPDVAFEAAPSAAEALSGAAAAVVVTGWDEFAALDDEFASMAAAKPPGRPVVVDGRRAVDPPEGVVYEGLTW